MTNVCDDTGNAHLTNYNDTDASDATSAANCDCNACDATSPMSWTAHMNLCCPVNCEAWKNKASPTPAPDATPSPQITIPKRVPDPARPFMSAEGDSLHKAKADGGLPYEQTAQEKKAEARLRVHEEIQRLTLSRAKNARDKSDELAIKLAKRTKPQDYDAKNEVVPKDPPFEYTHKWFYGNKYTFETGPVDHLPWPKHVLLKPGQDQVPVQPGGQAQDMSAQDSQPNPPTAALNPAGTQLNALPGMTMQVQDPSGVVGAVVDPAPATGGGR